MFFFLLFFTTLASAPVFAQVVTGGFFSCLLDSGRVSCWGEGVYGQLGTESTSSIGFNATEMKNLKPIPFNFTVTQIALGEAVLCAVGYQPSNASSTVSTCIGYVDDTQLGHNLGQGRPENCYGYLFKILIYYFLNKLNKCCFFF
jgi:hypothetical protein